MKRQIAFLGMAVAVLFASVVAPVSAADNTKSSSGLSINPRQNIVVEAGKSTSGKLNIGNLNNNIPLTVSIRVIDFTFTDQSGVPKLFLAADAPQTPWSLKPFLTLPSQVTVPAGQSKTINYTVKIPKGQGAGSYYSAITYSSGSGSGGNVNLSASGVTLMFVSVPGIVKEDLHLTKFGAFQTPNEGVSGSYAFINTKKPWRMAFTLKNKGNVAESPNGTITLRGMWGQKELTIDNVNPDPSLALIGQTRLFVTCIKTEHTDVNLQGVTSRSKKCADPNLKPGRYTADLDLFYGQNGNQTREITAHATFWYLPWWFIAIVVVVLLLLTALIIWLKRKIRWFINGPKISKFRARRR